MSPIQLANRRRHEAGFTMIELLVVVIIIAILAAIAVPVYIGIQNNAKKRSLDSDVATTKINLAAALAEEGAISDVTVDKSTATNDRVSGNARVQFSGAPADEMVQVDKLVDGHYTVKAVSASMKYCVLYSSLTGQTTTPASSSCVTDPQSTNAAAADGLPVHPTSAELIRPAGQDFYYREAQNPSIYTVYYLENGQTLNNIKPTAEEIAALGSVKSWYKTWASNHANLNTGDASHTTMQQTLQADARSASATIVAGGAGTIVVEQSENGAKSWALSVQGKDGSFQVEVDVPFGNSSPATEWLAEVYRTSYTAYSYVNTDNNWYSLIVPAAWTSSADSSTKQGTAWIWVHNDEAQWASLRQSN